MTLVIAKKFENNISLSSDSRISLGEERYVDNCIKIFSIPIKIYYPTSEDGNTRLFYESRLGVAVIGSLSNAFLVKDSISEILQRVQFSPLITKTSFESIINLINLFYKKFFENFSNLRNETFFCEIIITGYCLEQKNFRAFSLTIERKNSQYQPKQEELFMNKDIYFAGSGKMKAEEIYENDNTINPLKIIKKIIIDKSVDTVGGGLQYGEFNDKEFKIYGILDYSVDSNGKFKNYLFSLWGINLYTNEFEEDTNGLHISFSFNEPFSKEIEKLNKQIE